MKDNVLVIAALKPQTGEEEHGVYFQKERNFGRFYRKVPHGRHWIVVMADP